MNTVKIIILFFIAVYIITGIGLYFFQERLIFQIEKLPRDFKYTFQQPFEEHFLTMKDGAEINALHFKVDNQKGLILYFHGNAGSLQRWGKIITPLTELGYSVLIMDYRGYGKSNGRIGPKNMLHDSEEVYDFALNFTKEEDLILYGRSLGSAFASHLAGKKNPKMVILETPFYSLRDVVQYVAPLYPSRMLLKYRFNNEIALENSKCPIYLFHGTDDLVVPYRSAEKLYKSLDTAQAQFTVIESAGHNNLGDYPLFNVTLKKALLGE